MANSHEIGRPEQVPALQSACFENADHFARQRSLGSVLVASPLIHDSVQSELGGDSECFSEPSPGALVRPSVGWRSPMTQQQEPLHDLDGFKVLRQYAQGEVIDMVPQRFDERRRAFWIVRRAQVTERGRKKRRCIAQKVGRVKSLIEVKEEWMQFGKISMSSSASAGA